MMPLDSSRKRKWNLCCDKDDDNNHQGLKLSNSAVELKAYHSKSLPFEWQQCLDLESGQIYYYNSATRARTTHDPRERDGGGVEDKWLDLQLNISRKPEMSTSHMLPWKQSVDYNKNNKDSMLSMSLAADSPSNTSCVSTPACDEMVILACSECHMYVMVRRVFPTCPNCKHLHCISTSSSFANSIVFARPPSLKVLDSSLHQLKDSSTLKTKLDSSLHQLKDSSTLKTK